MSMVTASVQAFKFDIRQEKVWKEVFVSGKFQGDLTNGFQYKITFKEFMLYHLTPETFFFSNGKVLV